MRAALPTPFAAHAPGGVGRAIAVAILLLGLCGCAEAEQRDVPKDPPPPPLIALGTCAEAECFDFPNQPVLAGPTPRDAEPMFAGSPDRSTGVCLIEPADGAMLPNNWLPPRFRFEPRRGENLWQIRLSSRVERHDLVVYTTRPSWTMERSMWENLALHAGGESITVRIRGINTETPGPPSEISSSFKVAPVNAQGTIVYWAADGSYNVGGETKLVGFRIGDGGSLDALQLDEVEEFPTLDANGHVKAADDYAERGAVRCIGCHTSTPDGDAVAFVDNWPWNSVLASITEGSAGKRPEYVTQGAARIIQQPWQGTPTFSSHRWEEGERLMIQSFGNWEESGWPGSQMNMTNRDRLVWFNLSFAAELPESGPDLNARVRELEGTAFGFIERSGDPVRPEDGPRGAVNPDWSHSGTTIAYVSASSTLDGHPGGSPMALDQEVRTDIYLVPFEGGQGGAATPLEGASEPDVGEYYPDYSADDELIAFTRAPSITGPVYYRPDGEIWIVPSTGGEPVRLSANDPPACTGEVSPGVINSWPKWSPEVREFNGKRYYWLIFSSARTYPGQFTLPRDSYSPMDTRSSQLYIAGVVVDGDVIETYPAIYLYNQTTNTTNLTPAWDVFQIPRVEVE